MEFVQNDLDKQVKKGWVGDIVQLSGCLPSIQKAIGYVSSISLYLGW